MLNRLKQIRVPMFCACAIVLAGLSPLLLTGCGMTAGGLSKLMTAGQSNSAALLIDFTGFGGTLHAVRINPMTNTLPYSISRDGTITVDHRRTSGAMP